MGYIEHDAIIAVLRDREVAPAKAFVEGLPDPRWRALFGFMPAVRNGGTTVVMAPDGSKEGWPDSDEGDRVRAEFTRFLATCSGPSFHISMPEHEAPEIVELPNQYTEKP